jgi:kinetochore-associated protein 1
LVDCEADVAAFNADASFLVVGDRLGSVHFIHTTSKSVVFSQSLISVPDEPGNVPLLLHLSFSLPTLESEEDEEFLVVTKSMELMRFSCVNLQMLSRALASGDKHLAHQMKDRIQMSTIHLHQCHTNSFKDLLAVAGGFYTIGSGRTALGRWAIGEEGNYQLAECIDERLFADIDLVKAALSGDGRFLITLDSAHGLGLWDADR